MKEIKPGIVFTVSHRMKNFGVFRRESHCFGFFGRNCKAQKAGRFIVCNIFFTSIVETAYHFGNYLKKLENY